MTIVSARTVEVLMRWTEVHVKKLRSHKKEIDMVHKDTKQLLLDSERYYVYVDNTITVDICYRLCCKNEHNEWINCFHPSCESNEWIVRCKVYVSDYKDDVLFSKYICDDNDLSLLLQSFEKCTRSTTFCVCGRLARHDHLQSEKQGTCTNCYTYGFVRGEECSICMVDDGKPWLKTSCNHYFHDICWSKIDVSMYGIVKCPLCRSNQDDDTLVRL